MKARHRIGKTKDSTDHLRLANSSRMLPLAPTTSPTIKTAIKPKDQKSQFSKSSKKPVCQVIIPKLPPIIRAKSNIPEPKLAQTQHTSHQDSIATWSSHRSHGKQQLVKDWVESQRNKSFQVHDFGKKPTPPPECHHDHENGDLDWPSRRTPDLLSVGMPFIYEPVNPTISESTLEYLQAPPSPSLSTPIRNPLHSFLDLSPTTPVVKSQEEQHSVVRENPQVPTSSDGRLQLIRPNLSSDQIGHPKMEGSNPVGLESQAQANHSQSGASELDLPGTDPFGFLQAERELTAALTSRTVPDEIALDHPNSKVSTRQVIRSHAPQAEDQDPVHQTSDLSLGDLLKVNRTKRITNLKPHRPKQIKSPQPRRSSLSSSPRQAAKNLTRRHRPRRKAQNSPNKSRRVKNDENTKQEDAWLDLTSSRADHPNTTRRNLERATRLIDDSDNDQARQSTAALSISPDDRGLPTPTRNKPRRLKRVLIPKANLANVDRPEAHPRRGKNPGLQARNGKSSRTEKVDKDGESKQKTPSDRRARIEYFKTLDAMEFEEEVII